MTPREKFLKYMAEHHMTATDFAEKVKVSKGRISEYLKPPEEYRKKGQNPVQLSVPNALLICRGLGWTMDYLFEGKTYPPGPNGRSEPGVKLTNAEKLLLEVGRRVSVDDPELTEAIDRLYGIQRRRTAEDMIPEGSTWKDTKNAEPPRKKRNGPA